MLKFIFYFLVVFLFLSFLTSCNSAQEKDFSNIAKTDYALTKPDSLKNILKDISQFSDKQGVAGIFNVPEMLTIAKIDSAPMKNIPTKMAKNFTIIQDQLTAVDAKIDGAYGCIYYNNDAENFVFECIVPINKMPIKVPKNCKIVVLEADKMLIYNFYGSYQNLFSSYAIIRNYLSKNKLQQIGPMREFYITDPSIEKDPAKWLTRIMVPIKETN